MPVYIGLMRKDPDSDFSVDFPDFPGCITAGSTLEETRLMAEEALTGHIQVMLDYGDPIPEPSALAVIRANPDNRDAMPIVVAVPDHLIEQPRRRAVGE